MAWNLRAPFFAVAAPKFKLLKQQQPGNTQKMDWIPLVLFTFKVVVLGIGMFFAIKWHYDQGRKRRKNEAEMHAVLRASGKVSAVFVLSLLGLGLVTFALGRTLGLDLTLP